MRQLTFRGTIKSADNARTIDQKIFSYESADLTKAWKVKAFYLWPKTVRANTGSTSGQFMLTASLATDIIGSVGFDDIASVDDNRQIAWIQKGYNVRSSGPVSDFLAAPTGLESNFGLVDPDHLINRNLYINLTTISDSTVAPIRSYNYLVVLEPRKISENEAILQLVKGVAQDITN
tara:strand:+ start:158 stop:688 length:531 start_codon:yes stop_codon:yes gene_type:complete